MRTPYVGLAFVAVVSLSLIGLCSISPTNINDAIPTRLRIVSPTTCDKTPGSSSASPPLPPPGGDWLWVENSEFREPIIYATLLGFEKEDCDDDGILDADLAQAKLVALSGGGRLELLSRDDSRNQRTAFRLRVASPPWARQLCFQLHWRVEYSSLPAALADFPVEACSFRGGGGGSGVSPYCPSSGQRAWRPLDFDATADDDDDAAIWLRRQRRVTTTTANTSMGQQPFGKWEVYSAISPSWSSGNCRSWTEPRPYRLAIIGDSQPTYMCQHLLWGLGLQPQTQQPPPQPCQDKVCCTSIKNTLHSTLTNYTDEIVHSNTDVVVFNPAGLWETAYGSLVDFRDNFANLLVAAKVGGNGDRRYFSLPTTAVHPMNYPGIWGDERKWAMTQPRVAAINRIVAEEVSRRNIGNATSIGVVRMIEEISLARDDDPQSPGDMRHFGNATNELLLQVMLCQVDHALGF